jgi:hypothetical protein
LTQSNNDSLLPFSVLETPEELALYLLHRSANQAFHVISVNSEKNHGGNAISDLCCPHLAVINCSACDDASDAASRIHPWLAALPTEGTAVLVHPPRELKLDQYLTDGIRLVRVGVTENCDWRIRETRSGANLVQRGSEQGRVNLPVSPELPADDLATAYVISHLLSLDQDTFRIACRSVTNHNATCPNPHSKTGAASKPTNHIANHITNHQRKNLEFHR